MMKLPKTSGWASGVACLAIVAAVAGSAFAQRQENQSRQGFGQSIQSDSQFNSQSGQQSQQRKQQSTQSGQQGWQEGQQSQQRGQQYGRQGQQQSDEFGQQQWPSTSSEQWSQSGQRGQQAELGVNISAQGDEGLTVIRVRQGTAAEQMGLQRDDRITKVNGQQVQSERQFISQIRSMKPGEEVELEVIRDDEEQTFRGQLQPRQQSFAYSDSQRQADEIWQSGYEEREQSFQGRSGRSGDSSARIDQLERQVDRLSQQLDDLRGTIRDLRQQSGRTNRETTARYDEYGGQSPRRQSERWNSDTNRYGQSGNRRQLQAQQGQQGQRGQQSRQSDRYQSDEQRSSSQPNEPQSPGGEIGEDRLRTGAEDAQR